ncbi:MAG: hypothetical protein QXF85_02080, partial [Candidatus Micrarchaeaceae archaeon]
AVSELLERLKVQAKVIILRETHSGYVLPVGVWNVREHVREALRQEPHYFSTVSGALAYAGTKLDIKLKDWIRNSTVLQHILYQRTL